MRYIIILFLALFCCLTSAEAQSCYNENRSEGISLYERGEYEKAIGKFQAAKTCPDKPANDDLDAQISKCRTAIRKAEEDAERRRQEAERRRREQEEERRRRLNEARQRGYMEIERISFGNTDENGNVISTYGSAIYTSDLKYLKPRITYNGLASEKIQLYVKIYRPDGSLMTGTGSPDGYTFYDDVDVVEGSGNTLYLSGWGNKNGGAYASGTHRYELWYNGRQLTSVSVTLSRKAGEASRLTVDSKTAVTASFEGSGGRETFYVSTDADSYETWGVPTWCSVEGKSSTSFTLVCTPNSTGSTRTDYMEVRAGGKKVRIDISQPSAARSGKIEKVWVDHNQWNNGLKGMMVHVKFSVHGMKGREGICALYFSFGDGSKLKDFNNSFRTVDGQVSANDTFTPRYDGSEYADFKIFMPYNELHMQSGSKDVSLRFYVLLYDVLTEEDLAESDYTYFTFSN